MVYLIRKKGCMGNRPSNNLFFRHGHVAVYGTGELRTDGVHGYPIEIAEIQD